MRREKILKELTPGGYREGVSRRSRFTKYIISDICGNISSGSAKILEVGAGPGLVLEALLKSTETSVACIGVDIDKDMIPFMRDMAHSYPSRLFFSVNDRQRLPFREGSFDLAVSVRSLHHYLCPVAMLREMVRVLRPGGKVLVYDFNPQSLKTQIVKNLLFFYNHIRHHPMIHAFIDSVDVSYTKDEIRRMVKGMPDCQIDIIQDNIFNILSIKKAHLS